MGANRKLQSEIDRTLKKVAEGIEVFDQIWEKVRYTEHALHMPVSVAVPAEPVRRWPACTALQILHRPRSVYEKPYGCSSG